MANMWWSISLSLIGILGIFIAGKKNMWGWFIGFFAQFLWLVFAITTQQYGFILSAVAYGWVYGLNWTRWRKEKRESSTTPA